MIHPFMSITSHKNPARISNSNASMRVHIYVQVSTKEYAVPYKIPRHLKHNYPIDGRHLSDNPRCSGQDMHRVPPICK